MSDHRSPTPSTTRLAATPTDGSEPATDGSEPATVGMGTPDILTGLLAAAGIAFQIVYEGPAGRCPAGHELGRRAA